MNRSAIKIKLNENIEHSINIVGERDNLKQ